jgi:hypothetical protein
MKQTFVAHLALAALVVLFSACNQAHKKQQISTRPSLSTLAMADPEQLGYHAVNAAELLNSKSVTILPDTRKSAVAERFLETFIVYRHDGNHTIYIRRRNLLPHTDTNKVSEYGYLMRSFDCAGKGMRVSTPGLVMECSDHNYYGAIGTMYLSHALGESNGRLIIRNEGRHSYLAGDELECALNLSETGNDGLARASSEEPTGWLRSF